MQIRGKGVEFSRVCEIITRISNERYAGNVIVHQDASPAGIGNYGFKGRIIGISSSGMGVRRSWSGRRMNAACWHAFRDCIRAILTEYPNAVVTTAMARYEGLSGFERVYPDTAYSNVGSLFSPVCMPDLCECE